MKISKITLGTAQLGMDYGIANIVGKLDSKIANEILDHAFKNGINTIDTAPNYGNSEQIIGNYLLLNEVNQFIIVNKLPKIEESKGISFESLYIYIKDQINQSLDNLKVEKIPIYLLHNAPDIFLANGLIIECLNQIKKDGLIDKFGISAYNPKEVEESLRFKEIDVVEVPLNIFDQRLIQTGLIKKLKQNNYTIFARSIYLQGLIFIAPEQLPTSLKFAKDHIIKLKNLAKEFNISIAKMAFLYIRDMSEIDSIIIGMESIEQINRNLSFLTEDKLPKECIKDIYDKFSNLPTKLINPTLWNEGNAKIK